MYKKVSVSQKKRSAKCRNVAGSETCGCKLVISVSANDDEVKRFCMMFPDPQIAKGFKLGETKTKYTIQFGIASNFQKQQIIKPKNNMTSTLNSGEKNTSVLRYRAVELYPAHRLLEHFLEFMKKVELDLHFMVNIGMDGPNVSIKFEDFPQPSEIFDQLDIRISSIGTYPHSKTNRCLSEINLAN